MYKTYTNIDVYKTVLHSALLKAAVMTLSNDHCKFAINRTVCMFYTCLLSYIVYNVGMVCVSVDNYTYLLGRIGQS